MIETVDTVDQDALALYGAIIDVRSPAEFADDHIPGAINLPVLSNEERAEVGTIYVRDSRFRARRIGAAYVARNVAGHLETALSDRDARFRPLIYCWRGGMRSNAMATILSQVGWRVGVLKGGYRTWRRAVVSTLLDDGAPFNFVLIDGETGSAKTQIIQRLAHEGAQTIDLEGLAAHKGSVFGADVAAAQPPQKLFESRLYDTLRRLDPNAPIAIEAESSRIGRISLPKRVWMSMRRSPRLLIRADAAARARYVVSTYGDFIAQGGAIASAIERLRPFHAKETIEEWLALADARDHGTLAERLMRDHYDPLYQRARKRDDRKPFAMIDAGDLDGPAIDKAARAISALLKRSPP